MIVLHQGSGSPSAGRVRFHSLETWLFRVPRRRALLARTRQMADFGARVPNCPGADSAGAWRLLPAPGCRSGYEEWNTALDVGGVFGARPGFGVHDAITQFDPAIPGASCSTRDRLRPRTRRGWDSRCKGDRRSVLHPPGTSPTTAARASARTYGRARWRPASIVSAASAWISAEPSASDAFIAEQPSDGGIYRAGRSLRLAAVEFPRLLRDPRQLTYAALVQLIQTERRPSRPRSSHGLRLRELAPAGPAVHRGQHGLEPDGKATLDGRTAPMSAEGRPRAVPPPARGRPTP